MYNEEIQFIHRISSDPENDFLLPATEWRIHAIYIYVVENALFYFSSLVATTTCCIIFFPPEILKESSTSRTQANLNRKCIVRGDLPCMKTDLRQQSVTFLMHSMYCITQKCRLSVGHSFCFMRHIKCKRKVADWRITQFTTAALPTHFLVCMQHTCNFLHSKVFSNYNRYLV